MTPPVQRRHVETARHRTSYLEPGPDDGPLIVFLHGWPELSVVWRPQLEHLAAAGWHAVAPDMRGYGASSIPQQVSAYTVAELTADMVELHDALGAAPAVWVGHDWGAPVVWTMASHHPERCRAVAGLSVPYLARGFALPTLLPLVDRTLYPEQAYPAGQWDYVLNHRESFSRTVQDFEADVTGTLSLLYQPSDPAAVGRPSAFAGVRERGGWFGEARRPPATDRDTVILPSEDLDAMVAAFTAGGFSGPDAWYLNDDANLAHAARARDFGRLSLPVLFVHATGDTVCDTLGTALAEPMRQDCSALTEVSVEAGHELMLEAPGPVNDAITAWLAAAVPA